jgi:hypothetical protein
MLITLPGDIYQYGRSVTRQSLYLTDISCNLRNVNSIRSYLSTMQKQGHPMLPALTAVLHGHLLPVAWTPE